MGHRNGLLFCMAGLVAGITLLYNNLHPAVPALVILSSLLIGLKNRKVLLFALFFLAGTVTSSLHLRIPSNDIQRIAFPETSLAPHLLSSPPRGEGRSEGVTFTEAEGTILSVRPDTFATSYVVRIESVQRPDGKKLKTSGRILLKTMDRPYSAFIPGTCLAMKSLTLGKIPPPRNPYTFDYRSFMERRGIYLEGKAEELLAASRNRYSLSLLLYETKNLLKKKIEKYFAYFPEEKELIETITLGKEKIPDFLREAGTRSGTYHLLVISGLHIAFILLFLKIIFIPFARINNIHPKFFPFFSLLFMWFYAGLTGFKTPVVRAVLMLSFFNAGEILERDIDGPGSIMSAAILMLLLNPYSLFDASFQLSFIATAGIILFNRRFNLLNKGFLRGLALTSFAAQLAVFPILLHHFGVFYPAGLLTNLVFLPFTGLLVIVSLLSFLLPFLFEPLRYLLTLFLGGIMASSRLSVVALRLPVPLFLVIAFYAAIFLIFSSAGKKAKGALAVTASFFFLLYAVPPHFRQPLPDRIYFLSFSKPSVLYMGENDRAVAFLADHYKRPEIEEVLSPLLKAERITGTDLFYTTSSYDHAGTLKNLRKTAKVRLVYECAQAMDSFSFPYDNIYFYRSYPALFNFLSGGEKVAVNGLTVEVLGAEKETASYVLKKGGTSILLAPYLGEEISEKITGRRFAVAYINDVRKNAKTKKNLETVRFDCLILPKDLKKFADLPAPAVQTLYLNEGALRMDFSPPPFRLSRVPR